MSNGYVSLHRQIMDWEWYKDPIVSRIFIHLLLKATHQETKWQGTTIYPGQLITGREVLAKELGISEQNVRTALSKLKSTNEITIKSTNKFSVVSIVKWTEYQVRSTNRSTNKLTNNQPTTNQQLTTYNNNNNNNNKIIDIVPAKADTPLSKNISLYLHTFNELMGREFQLTPGRINKLKLRLNTYSMDQILIALRNMASDKFYKGDNDRGWSADPDFLIRSDEQIDKFLNKKPSFEKPSVKKLASDEMYAPDGSIVKRGGVAGE